MNTITGLLLLSTAFNSLTYAHKHHDELSKEAANAPIDALLWIHVAIQASVWAILFPIGMVFGITRSRWHVPLQITCFALTAGGYFLGHAHGGRQFPPSAHASFANILLTPIIGQLLIGVYLKLHIHEKSFRPMAVRIHGWLGRAYPILGWIQIIFGTITLRGDCKSHLDQCFGHYVMGSGFVAYGVLSAILLATGEEWIERTGDSPDWWDSWIIVIWGVVNALFARKGGKWSTAEIQQFSLGLLWIVGGALGAFLSRRNQRSVVPALILIITGGALLGFHQDNVMSTVVHRVFGVTLILAGISRIAEICTLPWEASSEDAPRQTNTTTEERFTKKSLRHLAPLFLVAAGFLFMSATDDGLALAHGNRLDPSAYALIMYSLAFALYTYVLVLCHLASRSGQNPIASSADNVELMSRGYTPVPKAEVAGS